MTSVLISSDLREMLPSAILLAQSCKINNCCILWLFPSIFFLSHACPNQKQKKLKAKRKQKENRKPCRTFVPSQVSPRPPQGSPTPSASFFQIGAIRETNPSISGMLGIRMHDWVHPQTNASFRHEHHFLHVSLSDPSNSRIDAAVESCLGGLGCVLRTWAMRTDLGGWGLRSKRPCGLWFDRIVHWHYSSFYVCVSRLFSNLDSQGSKYLTYLNACSVQG